jgi:hypothetical protein
MFTTLKFDVVVSQQTCELTSCLSLAAAELSLDARIISLLGGYIEVKPRSLSLRSYDHLCRDVLELKSVGQSCLKLLYEDFWHA